MAKVERVGFAPQFFFSTLTPRTLKGCQSLLTRANREIMIREKMRGNPLPALYDSGIRYRQEEPGAEHYCDYLVALGRGEVDCEDLAAIRCAELQVNGWPDARCVFVTIPIGQDARAHHVLVECNGTIEDPSRVLGMPLRRIT